MRLENLAGAISRIVIENKIARNKWIIMVKEKRQQPFFVPAERVKMNAPVAGVIWHDVIEQLWLVEKNTELARFYQALIQAAGAFVHLQKNFQHPLHSKHSRRLPPATRLFELALGNLEGLPNEFRTLDLVRFRELLRRYRDEIVAADFRRNPWSPDTAPKL